MSSSFSVKRKPAADPACPPRETTVFFFDRHGSAVQLSSLFAVLAIFAVAAFRLTLEADEANILLSAFNVFGIAVPQDSAAAYPTVTSGGVFPLLHGLLGLLTTNVAAHRAISLLLSVIFVATTFWLLRGMKVSRSLATAGAAMSAATPGFMLVGSAAMAEVAAALLLLWGLILWVRLGRRNIAGAILSGFLLGLACATRFNALFMLPAICLFALDFERGMQRKLLLPGLCAATSLIVLVAATQAYFNFAGLHTDVQVVGAVTGATGSKDLFNTVRFLIIASDWLPLWVIVAAAGLYVVAGRRILRRRDQHFTALLLLGGIIGWIMWVAKAPIPHIRYLWPALPCLWLGGIIVVLKLIEKARDPAARTWFHLAALAACLYQGLTSLYLIGQGDSLVVAYQLNRTSPLLHSGPNWNAASDQRGLAQAVEALPASAQLYTINRNAAFPITYLSGRTVAPLLDAEFTDKPAYMLALPGDYAIWRPAREGVAWRQQHAKLVWRRGNYALYRINSWAPTPPPETAAIGENDIYPAP